MGGILCKQKLCEVLSFMDILPFFTHDSVSYTHLTLPTT